MISQQQKDLYDSISDGVYIVDLDRKICYWNKAAEKITGYSADELVGKSCADNILIHIDDQGMELCTVNCPLAESIHSGKPSQANVYLHHKDGHRVPVYIRTAPFSDEKHHIIGGIELFTEMSASQFGHKKASFMNRNDLIDHMTNLPNRRYLHSEIISDLFDLRTHDYAFGALLFEIDHLAGINEKYGRSVGDRIVKMVANTIAYEIRPFDVVGRWGGDEFLGLFTVDTQEHLEKIATRLMELLKQSKIILKEEVISSTISCAGTMAKPEDSADSLMERINRNMGCIKEKGANGIVIGE